MKKITITVPYDILKNKLFIVIAMLAYLKPASFDTLGLSSVNSFFNLLRIFCAVIICVKCIPQKKCFFIIWESVFWGIYILCYVFNLSDIRHILIMGISTITFTLLIDYSIKARFFEDITTILSVVYLLLLAINLYLIVQNQGWAIGIGNSVYDSYSFLNSDNGTASYIFPAILISQIYSCLNKKKFTILNLSVLILSILNAIRVWSATTILGLVLYCIYLLFIYKKPIENFINKKLILIISILLNLSISFFHIQYIFSYIIETLLQKSVTLTGRIRFWDIGIEGFIHSPLIGNGLESIYIDNMVIQLLYRGGILLISTFIILLYCTLKKSLQNSKDPYSNLCIAIVIIIIIMSIAESWNSFLGFYIIICLTYYSPLIENK